MQRRYFLLLFLLIFLLQCVKEKNRVKIIGGHYRVVTYEYAQNDSIKIIRPAKETDTILGLGISFNIDFFSDATEFEPIISTYTPGWKGPMDSIKKISISYYKSSLLPYLQNTPNIELFRMKRSFLKSGAGYAYSNWKREAFETYSFDDINDFINKYNNRWYDFTIRRNLEHEIFFWFPPESNIRYEDLQDLDFKIYFTDGRVVEITPYDEKD